MLGRGPPRGREGSTRQKCGHQGGAPWQAVDQVAEGRAQSSATLTPTKATGQRVLPMPDASGTRYL